MQYATAFALGFSLVGGMAMIAQDSANLPSSTGARQVSAAKAFVASLSDAERAKAARPLADGERVKWYFARGDRDGLFLRDMDAETRAATLALVDSMLSASGREQWRLIRVTEAINGAHEREAGTKPPTWGDDLYAVHLFGDPSSSAWAFEIEGHHFVHHLAFADGVVTVTPAFTGSFPAEIGEGPDQGKRPLGPAVEVAFELANSFDATQRSNARIMDGTPADVLWAVGSDAKAPDMRGVTRATMTKEQQAIVDRLLAVHAGLFDSEVAHAQLREWRTKHAGVLTFAFVGETDVHKAHYYRIATPCFTIEYDSTNADASHVHCVWSDPTTNFGGNAMRAHISADHAK